MNEKQQKIRSKIEEERKLNLEKETEELQQTPKITKKSKTMVLSFDIN